MRIKRVTAHPIAYPEPNDYDNTRSLILARVEADGGRGGLGRRHHHLAGGLAGGCDDHRGRAGARAAGAGPAGDRRALARRCASRCGGTAAGGIASFAVSAVGHGAVGPEGQGARPAAARAARRASCATRLRACASSHPNKGEHRRDGAGDRRATRRRVTRRSRSASGRRGTRGWARTRPRCRRSSGRRGRRSGRPWTSWSTWATRCAGMCTPRSAACARSRNRTSAGSRTRCRRTTGTAYRQLRARHEHAGRHGRARVDAERVRSADRERGWRTSSWPTRDGWTGSQASGRSCRALAAANRAFNAHSWAGALNTAASIHLTACAADYIVMEIKPRPSPPQHDIVAEPIEQRDGWIAVPDRPGLGVEIRGRYIALTADDDDTLRDQRSRGDQGA